MQRTERDNVRVWPGTSGADDKFRSHSSDDAMRVFYRYTCVLGQTRDAASTATCHSVIRLPTASLPRAGANLRYHCANNVCTAVVVI